MGTLGTKLHISGHAEDTKTSEIQRMFEKL